jgi:hypothetical protein
VRGATLIIGEEILGFPTRLLVWAQPRAEFYRWATSELFPTIERRGLSKAMLRRSKNLRMSASQNLRTKSAPSSGGFVKTSVSMIQLFDWSGAKTIAATCLQIGYLLKYVFITFSRQPLSQRSSLLIEILSLYYLNRCSAACVGSHRAQICHRIFQVR